MASYLLMRICFILYLTSLISTNDSEFAVFQCQKKVTVCKNDEATLTCSSTQKFDGIELYFHQEDKNKNRLLFNMTGVGKSFQHGMQFELQEKVATLVIRNIQVSHRGSYQWVLMGKGSSNKYTKLDVLESPTISKENDTLICQAIPRSQRRITWSNDLPEFTTNPDTTGLLNLSISQSWDDSFNDNPPCCKIIEEEDSQELCAETCYHTSTFAKPISGIPETLQRKIVLWPLLIISILIAILFLGLIWHKKMKNKSSCFFRNGH
ncbi:uncharacterized protein LOC100619270 isoform X1 [Monodelphis domestica]|uniref:uncharacterized protein LOC100619270 isoform X1 n=1 Tax=Monodelphis domestica TaxID=13616 RepID=UPI0004432250|nr:uncharacterized protein LOC100619270 isoform X1 [Monodelphis domestica]XP_007482861.1 uncharacterized protein LOC100619270 isoform X1 [Monodelphis domestica]